MDKEYPGHAQKLMNGLWGQGQMSFCKAVLVVDRGVNPQDPVAVMEKLVSTLDLTTDISVSKGILDVLDHSSSTPHFGHKIGIDLTERFAGEPLRTASGKGLSQDVPEETELISRLQLNLEEVTGLSIIEPKPLAPGSSGPRNSILALNVKKGTERGGRYFADRLLEERCLELFNILILFDPDISLEDNSRMLWKLFHNTDPGRDLYMRDGRVVVNACVKGPMDGHLREWPEELTFECGSFRQVNAGNEGPG